MADTTNTQADPDGVQAAIDRYRDLAKYLITIFAGVGALLVAGTQLASIGKLSWSQTQDRVLAAGIGLAFAVGAVACVVMLALRVLKPVEMSLDDVIRKDKLRKHINARPSILCGAGSVEALPALVNSRLVSQAVRDKWAAVADDVVAEAAYFRMRSTFEGAWKPMLAAAIAGVLGISAFAWGANPPDSATASPVVLPAPAQLTFTLTAEGRKTLSSALGAKCVAGGPISALAVGGEQDAPLVVTLPNAPCKSAQFTLNADWGAPIATKKAPAS